ncbi:extracellular solute-binding protein family 1 [Caldicellulosiruptor hydrothermalis 108]|uniref:Extracellular solute-binding protein family 1 n=1 Tax=Caldicellulosiruptor hydrothermalis (strain DSM 18901 / VKM B-2411 / 108) TaxID=632292 RepID=E4Q7Y7_CALH1|nr:extracellular solute-binding protein [Caldicellulosiruptor hydrothermalis]ADQ07905.1 extracellular solute-binding protein family 1 [Caldicellulosiruptor hydrothermalis 108]
MRYVNKKVISFIMVGCMFILSTLFYFDIPNHNYKNSKVLAATGKKVVLTVLTDNTIDLEAFKAVAAAFEKKYNIRVEIELRPGGTEGPNIVKTRLAAGEMDDLSISLPGSIFLSFNPSKYFVDLTKETYMKNIEEKFKKAVSVNGRVYGVPVGPAWAGVWLYNKKVANQLKLSVPKTWNELLANCSKIKAAGKVPIIASYRDAWTAQLIWLIDYYWLEKRVPDFAEKFTANKIKFANTPAAVRGFEKLQEIYKKGYLNKDFLATSYDTALKMLATGEGVYYPMLTMALTAIEANFPDKINDIGAFPQPDNNPSQNGITVWLPKTMAIYKFSKNIEAAKKFVAFFVSAEGLKAWLTKGKVMGPFMIKNIKIPQNTYIYPAVRDILPYYEKGKFTLALEFLSPLKGPNAPQICVEVASGMRTPVDGAKLYDKDVEKQAKQLNLPGW